MGAYYTPQPVVSFIVRAVDYLLKTEFNLPNGLADSAKAQNGIHKVQILDPAVGTGTFLSSVIRNIYKKFEDNGQLGRWTSYVHHDLLPRIHGFEIMMAPYTIAHLKLSMAFKTTCFKHFNRRLGIYLTNSLEEADSFGDLFTGFGFAESIAEESKVAASIKNDTPIMVVIGNPPYSVSSSNKGKWITDLIKVYKKDLNERNIQPLSDDYIKFIRYAEHFVEKNKSGIVAMITNNSFLDGIIHRQMRKHLLETFDEIYILDLHGNSKKKETAPDGSKDENVFDIMQGVSISLMIKKKESTNKLAVVKFAELYGKREFKFDKLNESDFNTIEWKTLDIIKPNYFLVFNNFGKEKYSDLLIVYQNNIALRDLFNENSMGIATGNDNELVSISKEEIIKKFSIASPFYYRPFDIRFTIFDNKILQRARFKLMNNYISHDNIGLNIVRQSKLYGIETLITNNLTNRDFITNHTYNFPLYLYSKDGTKTPNLNQEILEQIEKTTGKTEPEEILDYIYAVLHSPNYRQKYKEFLKIDFPRVPYPKDKTTFKKFVKLGTELREIHLLESPKVNQFITTFPKDGTCEVEKIRFNSANREASHAEFISASNSTKVNEIPEKVRNDNFGNVWINNEQYFGKVPETAWNFYIGGYQPAQKWLKDRKGRTLTNEEIEHYQKIIVALTETDRIMQEIDKIK